MRKIIDFNEKWHFHRGEITVERPVDKGPVYAQSKTERKKSGPASYFYYDKPDGYTADCELRSEGWEYVNLPHDYVIEQDNDQRENNALGYLKYENAWYRKHFTLTKAEAENKRVLLRFDGIAGKSTVYLNGCLMYHNFSSYNTFEIDISDYVYYDKENIVAVHVETDEFEGWWYQGGGIYRNVYLSITEPVAIDLWGVYAPYEKVGDNRWRINFETTVVNTDFEDKDVLLKSMVYDQNDEVIAEASTGGTVLLRDKSVLKYSTIVENPLLWSCDTPDLYKVKTVLKLNGGIIDENLIKIGFRTVELSAEKGLLINGEKTFINGVCAHQDFGLTGIAVPDNVARYKVRLIKEMGANGYRTSHYQQTESYMDAFDEMGFLVMDETRWFESTKESFEQIESLVKRDRNRPSVIFWSTGNEEPLYVTDNGRRIHVAIVNHIRKFDKTRFITAAQDKTPDKSAIYGYCDVIGINYNLKIYDDIHKMWPEKLIFASECCATGTSRDWNFPSNTDGRLRDKDGDTNTWFLGREKTWKFFMERPYVIGAYQWIAVDHRGEAMWPAICSKSGALDLFLQKKGAYYQNKSHWTDEPMAHIVPHWNFSGLEGEDILVTVYTNCDELELFLNGASQGRKKIEKYGHGEWSVIYSPGTLEVKGYIMGQYAAGDIRVTTKKASRLKLTLNNDFTANGRDLALFTCECLDDDGNTVPDASEFVEFSVETPAKIIGTGSDNCDHNRVTLAKRKMYMGKISVAVRPAKNQKTVILMATSVNCGSAVLKLNI